MFPSKRKPVYRELDIKTISFVDVEPRIKAKKYCTVEQPVDNALVPFVIITVYLTEK